MQIRDVQAAYQAWLSAGKTDADKELARTHDAASHAELKALARLDGNDQCADCTATRPGWASLPHGTFICMGARARAPCVTASSCPAKFAWLASA